MCHRLQVLVVLAALVTTHAAEQGADNLNLLQKPTRIEDVVEDALQDAVGAVQQVMPQPAKTEAHENTQPYPPYHLKTDEKHNSVGYVVEDALVHESNKVMHNPAATAEDRHNMLNALNHAEELKDATKKVLGQPSSHPTWAHAAHTFATLKTGEKPGSVGYTVEDALKHETKRVMHDPIATTQDRFNMLKALNHADALKHATKKVLDDEAPHAPATVKSAEHSKDAVSEVMPKIEAHGNVKDGNGVSLKISFGNAPAQATPPVSYKAAAAEYIAMTLFVVIGCGSAMVVCGEPGWVLQVALTFGLAITSLAYTVGHFSGGQINCAVTLGLVLAGKLTAAQGVTNFVAQILGSLTGALLLTLMIPESVDKTGGLGTNKIADKLSKINAFVGEFLMTFLLMFVVLETAVNPATKANREMAALAIGFAVFLAHAVLINVDGCSINPTRTFGPAMVRQLLYKNKADSLDEQLVFWAGPLLGAAGAVAVSAAMR